MIYDERLVSNTKVKPGPNISRSLKEFDGLTLLTLTAPIIRQIYATARAAEKLTYMGEGVRALFRTTFQILHAAVCFSYPSKLEQPKPKPTSQ